MYVHGGLHKNMWPEENHAVKVYMPSWGKEKGGAGRGEVVVWDLKGQEGNSHLDGKASIW